MIKKPSILRKILHFFVEPSSARRHYMLAWLEEEIAEYYNALEQWKDDRSTYNLLSVKQEALDVLGCLYFLDIDKIPDDPADLVLLIRGSGILAECELTVDMVRAWCMYQETRLRRIPDAQIRWMSDMVGKFSAKRAEYLFLLN